MLTHERLAVKLEGFQAQEAFLATMKPSSGTYPEFAATVSPFHFLPP